MKKLKQDSRVNKQLKFFGKLGFHSVYSKVKPRIRVAAKIGSCNSNLCTGSSSYFGCGGFGSLAGASVGAGGQGSSGQGSPLYPLQSQGAALGAAQTAHQMSLRAEMHQQQATLQSQLLRDKQ